LTDPATRGIVPGINLLFLLFVAVLPFSTSLMVTHLSGPDVAVALLIYGLNVLAASPLLTFLMAHLVRERALLIDDVADETLAAMTRQRRVANSIGIIAVVCALVAPLVAVALYMVATIVLLVLPIVLLGRNRVRASGSRAVAACSAPPPRRGSDPGPGALPSSHTP
jgi:uncharacterized membrane protein